MNLKLRMNLGSFTRQVALAMFISCVGLIIGYLATNPGQYRLLIAITVFAGLFAISLRKPVISLFIILILLPFTGLFRRLLIPVAGWTSFDPLLLVAPVLILIFGAHWFVKRWLFEREPIKADTRLFMLVLLFLLLSCIQIVNPLQGSLLVGAGGVLYYIVPLMWMVLSREYFNTTHMRVLQVIVYVIGLVAAIYGIIQTHVGFTSFEILWIDLGGYAALRVGESVRAFSVFPSAQEFVNYMSMGVAIGWAHLLRGRWIFKILIACTLPVLCYAIFMVGSRTPVILNLLAITIVTLLMYRSIWARILIVLVAIAVGVLGMNGLSKLADSKNDLILHQVNGLMNPLDEEHSTFFLHLDYFIEGIIKGFRMPIGHGLGSSTQAAKTLGGAGGQNTEYDISDIMVSHGIVGGVLYLLMMVMVLRLLFSLPRQDPLNIALLGTMLATIGFWMIGELTAVNAVLWVSIGYLDKMMKHHHWNVWKSNQRPLGACSISENSNGERVLK